ncbi:MAG: hypothetical protein HXY22_12980 [Alphaproteobacteria bacterium]|nr:hypothetical protein [Alphaproteobacteria bacterium]
MAAFVLAVALTAALGTAVSAQLTLTELVNLGVAVTDQQRIEVTLHDLRMMAPLYAAVVAVGFLIALTTAGFMALLLPSFRRIVFLVAGAAAILTALYLMRELMGFQVLAGARTSFGLAMQVLCGAIGGYFFALIKRAA